MSESESMVNKSDEIVIAFRGRRLLQVVKATEATLLAVLLYYSMSDGWEIVPPIFVVMVLVSSVIYFIRINKVDLGAAVLLTIVTCTMIFFMWTYEGLKDETLLIFPGILIFAVILGNQKLSIGLFIFMIVNILAIGYANDAGMYVNETSQSSLSAAIVISIVMLLISYSVWLLSSDLRELLEKIAKENTRVLQSNKQVKKLLKQEQLLREAEENLHKLQKLENIGVLAGGIAHDFNNILASIFGNISLAKMKIEKGHPSFENLEKSEQSMERATQLTGQLLTFAKGGEPIMENVDLSTVIKESILFDLAGSNVKPVFNFSEDLNLARVDKGQIQQVMSNLVINAAQSMKAGGVVDVSVKDINLQDKQIDTLSNGNYLKIEITDQGSGIDEDTLSKIFDPYFTTKKEGNGLGLAIVHSIIKKHGGSVQVESVVGEGTCVILYLPAAESQVQQSEQPSNHNLDTGDTNKVLVMDDDEAILSLVSAIFEAKGFSTTTAIDGAEMLKHYQAAMEASRPFDAVIMDLTIPGGMGGKEAIEQLIKLDANAKCVVSSGYADDPIMANYNDYGFQAAISKPFNLEDLYSLVVGVISERKKT